jgi:hypothetical protein
MYLGFSVLGRNECPTLFLCQASGIAPGEFRLPDARREHLAGYTGDFSLGEFCIALRSGQQEFSNAIDSRFSRLRYSRMISSSTVAASESCPAILSSISCASTVMVTVIFVTSAASFLLRLNLTQ